MFVISLHYRIMERLMTNLAEMKPNQEMHQENAAAKVADNQGELRKDLKAKETDSCQCKGIKSGRVRQPREN
jgi:hypothetical protein